MHESSLFTSKPVWLMICPPVTCRSSGEFCSLMANARQDVENEKEMPCGCCFDREFSWLDKCSFSWSMSWWLFQRPTRSSETNRLSILLLLLAVCLKLPWMVGESNICGWGSRTLHMFSPAFSAIFPVDQTIISWKWITAKPAKCCLEICWILLLFLIFISLAFRNRFSSLLLMDSRTQQPVSRS